MKNNKKVYVSPEMELVVVDDDILTLSLDGDENLLPDVEFGTGDND